MTLKQIIQEVNLTEIKYKNRFNERFFWCENTVEKNAVIWYNLKYEKRKRY